MQQEKFQLSILIHNYDCSRHKKGIMNRGKKICLSPSNGLINQPMNNNTQAISKFNFLFGDSSYLFFCC